MANPEPSTSDASGYQSKIKTEETKKVAYKVKIQTMLSKNGYRTVGKVVPFFGLADSPAEVGDSKDLILFGDPERAEEECSNIQDIINRLLMTIDPDSQDNAKEIMDILTNDPDVKKYMPQEVQNELMKTKFIFDVEDSDEEGQEPEMVEVENGDEEQENSDFFQQAVTTIRLEDVTSSLPQKELKEIVQSWKWTAVREKREYLKARDEMEGQPDVPFRFDKGEYCYLPRIFLFDTQFKCDLFLLKRYFENGNKVLLPNGLAKRIIPYTRRYILGIIEGFIPSVLYQKFRDGIRPFTPLLFPEYFLILLQSELSESFWPVGLRYQLIAPETRVDFQSAVAIPEISNRLMMFIYGDSRRKAIVRRYNLCTKGHLKKILHDFLPADVEDN